VSTQAAADPLQRLLDRGGPAVGDALAAAEERLRTVVADAGVPLAPAAAETIAAGGKRLRPLLVVLAASAGGVLEGQHVVRAAVAVELVHSATLVHDDIVDGARLRRGRPTVVARHGRAAAVGTGDLLFSRAFAELAAGGEVEPLRILTRASRALAAGELMQREDAYRRDVSVERYLRRCELKTAALFEAACALGALPAGDDLAGGLALFARRIGLAFQLFDDVLDVAGGEEHTGKKAGADLRDGTVTLPLIIASERDGAVASVDLRELDGEASIAALCARIAATGALESSRERALGYVASAKEQLGTLLAPDRRVLLSLLADAVVERRS